ncbi:hypothetical protein [Actinomadura barringtoniae]|nr:hypothetical protein [Actinomadura barringtoniae]
MADCERGLGRPERALDLIKSPDAKKLDPMGRVELRIVESGARRDLGQYDAAVVALQIPELRDRRLRPWSARLFYAYADALADAERTDEASEWFARAAAADRDGETDAAERYAELEGLDILDTEEDEEEEAAEETEIPADEVEASVEEAETSIEEAETSSEEAEASAAREPEAPVGPEAEAPAEPEAPAVPEIEVSGVPGIEFTEPDPEPAPEPPAEAPETSVVFLEPVTEETRERPEDG